MDLVLVSAAVLTLGVAMYVILDGFDLGVGILFPFAPQQDRTTMMNSIAPVWDGNETWLVLGGAVLLAAFPAAYSILLPAWYLPLIAFLFALVFRGVAFEFRASARNKAPWGTAFSAGSIVATAAQGTILGSFIEGVRVEEGAFAGGALDWASPFSLLAGLGLLAGYGLLGATWLVWKTEGELQAWAYRAARRALVLTLLFILLVSVYTPLAEPDIARRWFGWPNLLFLSPVPALTALIAVLLWRALRNRQERSPFWLGVGLFLLSYFGLAVSLWPYIVPRALTIWDAASPPATQAFILTGVVVLLPLVLGYTMHTYRVFRHKVSADEHY
jgi:cytochrome d ubiquinol oxidase subunit II